MRDSTGRAFGLALLIAWVAAPAVAAAAGEPAAPEATVRTGAATRRELVFIDARISERRALLNDLRAQSDATRTLDVIVVDAERDGLAQISDALAGRDPIAAIHILSHGSEGRLLLGNRELDSEALRARVDLLSGWATALTPDSDILLYGCDAGAGESGRSLMQTLARVTGADVAASRDPTGNRLLGGDWDLERHTGTIETRVAPSARAQRQWAGVLTSNGTVAAEQKISDLAGGLAAILDNSDVLGLAVAGIGDLDNDGIEDIAVGAYQDDDGGTNRGAVYVLFLNTNGTVKAEQKISDTVGGLAAILVNNDNFGSSVDAIGDLDNDGVEDIVVGAHFDDNGGIDRGAVYILFLNTNGTVKAEQKISSTVGGLAGPLDNSDRFGIDVAGIGDLDNDGVEDIAVGAIFDDDGGADRGAVYVLFLNTNGTVKAEQKISSTVGGLTGPLDNSDFFGISVAGIGDLDGDSVEDIAVGAILDDDGGADRGALYVLFLNSNGTVKAEQKISDTVGGLAAILDNGDNLGTSVDSMGDLDGDGVNDIAVGAWTDDDGGADRGAVYVLFLNSNGTVKAERKISDTVGGLTATLDNSDAFGRAVTSIGDLNGDGVNDIAVGASGDDDGGTDRGAVYILFLAPGCCSLSTAETATTLTITGAGQFEMGFNTATGGGIDRLYDLAEDPTRLYDLAGGAGDEETLLGLWVEYSGTYYTTNGAPGSKLDLLEATPTRVRVRGDSFFEADGGTTILPGMKGVTDYSVYGIGRTAARLTDLNFDPSPRAYASRIIDTNAHWTAGLPLSNYLRCYQGNAACGAGAGSTGQEDWLLGVRDVASARTDFLFILSQDWAQANSVAYFSDNGPSQYSSQSWTETASVNIPASQSWNLLTYFRPTNLVSTPLPAGDPAVTSRSNDYRTPSAVIALAGGSQWQDAAENTAAGADFFNESEAAYALDMSFGSSMSFDLDVAFPRYHPFFKIRNWRSFSEAPLVTLESVALVKNLDYKAAVKPVSRAHFAADVLWHSTLQDATSVNTSPDIGSPGVSNAVGYVAARYGQGADVTANNQYISFPVTNGAGAATEDFDGAKGAVEFWYKPTWNHNDTAQHDLGGVYLDVNNHFQFQKLATNVLRFRIAISGTFYDCTVAAANYSWRANDWVHLRFEWDDSPVSGPEQRIVINQSVPTQTCLGNWTSGGVPPPNIAFRIGDIGDGAGTFGAGTYDEVHSYGRRSGHTHAEAPTTPKPLAHGGLTSDAAEYLADSSAPKNFPLAFDPADANRRGEYAYFGADSKFRGLNVSLATPGSWAVAGDLSWQYWDGSGWANLESFGFIDETAHFTKAAGTIYWTSDPTTWAPYSVNGEPDLYYVRARLLAGEATPFHPRSA